MVVGLTEAMPRYRQAVTPSQRVNSFHGALMRNGVLGDLRVTEVAYPPGLEIPEHAHQHAYVGITLSGASLQWCGAERRFSKAWTVTYHPPQEIHRDRFEPSGAMGLNVEFMPGFLERLDFPRSLLEQGFHSPGGETAWLAARLYREFLQADEPAVAGMEGLALELLAHLWRCRASQLQGKPPLWLQRVKEILRARLSERLTLLDLSAWADVHPVHVARAFRKFHGCTVGDYIRHLRVEHACRVISQQALPLAEVALSSGFSDQSQFCKTFKNLTGMTPREYREATRRVGLKQKS